MTVHAPKTASSPPPESAAAVTAHAAHPVARGHEPVAAGLPARPQDRYSKAPQNIAALAAHIDATRRIERYGVATAAETLQAFQALPPPTGSEPTRTGVRSSLARPWRTVLGVTADAPLEVAEAAYKALARTAHPDNGGGDVRMAELNAARDAARSELG